MTEAATRRFTVLSGVPEVAEAAADRFVRIARASIEERGVFRVALSGGSTPKAVYPRLTARPWRDRVNWPQVEFFWADERAVPPDHPDSNFGVAYHMLIAQLPGVEPLRVHRMPAEAPDLDAAALAYEAELRLVFGARDDEPPAFDLIWLGMGGDGHTASLFPGARAVGVTDRWVVATHGTGAAGRRMTLTLPVLNAASEALFVVTGTDKADALRAIRDGEPSLPAAHVNGPSVEWIIDRAASGEAP